MLSQTYHSLLKELLEDFSRNIRQTPDYDFAKKKYALFVPEIGLDYHKNKDLLVIGQAVNGWEPSWSLEDIKENQEYYLKESVDFSLEDKGKCPLNWINENWTGGAYPMYRSFFWNVTYKLIMQNYKRTDTDWNHVAAYSNLMKISDATGGNPDYYEKEAQLNYAGKLLRQELLDLKPKNVLIITNLDTWAAPVLEKAGISYKTANGKFLQATAKFQDSNILITKRPFAASHKLFIQEISEKLV